MPFGLFVALDDIFIEGCCTSPDLGSDCFTMTRPPCPLMSAPGKQFTSARPTGSGAARAGGYGDNKIDFRLIEGPLPVELTPREGCRSRGGRARGREGARRSVRAEVRRDEATPAPARGCACRSGSPLRPAAR